jgi:ferredoxin
MSVRIHVDVGRCQGYGNCVIADDTHFDLDDEGLVVVLDDRVAPADRERAAAAARNCPADAIRLADEDEDEDELADGTGTHA